MSRAAALRDVELELRARFFHPLAGAARALQ